MLSNLLKIREPDVELGTCVISKILYETSEQYILITAILGR